MSAPAVFLSQRRGACPGLSAPMRTGDGLLVRLLPVGTIALDALRALCRAARLHGNGVIEITARGSIQVRGLTVESAPPFADTIAGLGIAAQDGIPVVCNALAGLDPNDIIDAAALATELRLALANTQLAANLAPKVSVAIDGGGMPALDEIATDVRLCARSSAEGTVLEVGLAGDIVRATKLGFVALDDGIDVTMRLLDVIARRGRTTRARDVIAADGATPFRIAIAAIAIGETPMADIRKPDNPIGAHRLRDGSLAMGIGLPFGHTEAAALEHLGDAAGAAGAGGVRAAAGRILFIIGVPEPALPGLAAAAVDLGFIVRPDDPRRHVFACAGAPACAAAYIAARSIAGGIAEFAAADLRGDLQVHISGCSKGCARAGAAALTVVGGSGGCGLIANGTAHDAPFATVGVEDLPRAIGRHIREQTREVGRVRAHV